LPLTDKQISTARPREKKYKLFDEKGLFLLLVPRGGKYWKFKYTRAGRAHEVALGAYPDVSLKVARDRRDDERRRLVQGEDPAEHKRTAKAKQRILFRNVADEWLALQIKPNANGKVAITGKSAQKQKRIVHTHLSPMLGNRPIGSITSPQLLEALREIEAKGLHQTAHNALGLASRIFCYAIATGLGGPQGDPAWPLRRGVLAPVVSRSHPSITKPPQVGELLLAIDEYEGKPITYCALKLSPLVMVRPSELRFAQWSEFDLEGAGSLVADFKAPCWLIPKERMKMDAPHIVPLSNQAVEILRRLQKITGAGIYLFPSYHDPNGVISNNTVGKALTLLGYARGKMSAHGFRSMASTMLNEQQRWHPDAIERQLAHGPRDKVRGAYNYAEHLRERRKMMQAWADYLDELRERARKRTQATRNVAA
jgi:integrase